AVRSAGTPPERPSRRRRGRRSARTRRPHPRRPARLPRRAAAEPGASPADGLRGGLLRARPHAAAREPRARHERAAGAGRRAARDQRADVDACRCGRARSRGGRMPPPLAHLRVVDLTDLRGAFAGRLLADLGADVVKVEPPRGDAGRFVPPFAGGVAAPDRSLPFLYRNANKRGAVLDLHEAGGWHRFGTLCEQADILIENLGPEGERRHGLTPAEVQERHPHLVHVALADFGLTGPRAGWRLEALPAFAASGALHASGFPDRPPCWLPGYAAHDCGATFAVAGALAAVLVRARSGAGQTGEVSVQAAALAGRPRAEVLAEGRRLGVPITAVNTPEEFVAEEQTRVRGYFRRTGFPHLGDAPFAPAPFNFSRTPAVLERPAPAPGAAREGSFPPRAPGRPGGDGPQRPALAGLRVIDLGCGVAIPETGTLLAELGAEVIKIESRANIDFLRRVTVEPDAVNRSWTFNDASRGQLSVALDLRAPRGRELA